MKQYQCIICDCIINGEFKPIQCPECESELISEVMTMPDLEEPEIIQ